MNYFANCWEIEESEFYSIMLILIAFINRIFEKKNVVPIYGSVHTIHFACQRDVYVLQNHMFSTHFQPFDRSRLNNTNDFDYTNKNVPSTQSVLF